MTLKMKKRPIRFKARTWATWAAGLAVLPLLSAVVTATSASRLDAAETKSLIKDYRDAKAKLKGAPKDRAVQVKETLVPILAELAKVEDDEVATFLAREIDESESSQPEAAAACADALARHPKEAATQVFLKSLPKRTRPVGAAFVDGFSKSKKEPSAFSAELLAAAQAVQDAEVKRLLAPVLGRLDSLAAAKVLLAQVQGPRGGKPEEASAYSAAVVAALEKTKQEEIKSWLAKGAFQVAGGDTWKLTVVLKLVAQLELGDAREEVEKLTSHPAPDVAAAATAAIARIGFGEDPDEIVASLEKHRGKDVAYRIHALDALAKTQSDRAVEVVLRYARGKDPEMRAVAMGSLAFFQGNAKAQAGLVEGLKDPDPSIRSTALRAVGRMREKFAIEPLISMLGKEKEERIRVDALKLLIQFTGQNMGLVEGDWRKWWELADAKFEFPKADGKEGFTNVRIRDLSYFGIEISSKRIGFLVDISSSMLEMVAVRTAAERKAAGDEGGTTVVEKPAQAGKDEKGGQKARKIDILKRELAGVLKKLPADAQINILTFHRVHDAWQKQLQPLAGQGRAKAVQYVENLKTGVGTNVFDTLDFALKDRRIDTIYLLTDGVPTAGKIVDPAAIRQEVQVQNRLRGVTIHCIAFGEESKFLEELAKENGGEYRFVDRY